MYENRTKKETNHIKLMLISVCLIIMFIVGFISGSSFIYGVSSSEIKGMKNQIQLLQNNDSSKTTTQLINTTYYYNETSLSDLYKEVKDSIVVIKGIIPYQTFFNIQYAEVQGSGFIYEYNDKMVVVTNNHVVSDASDIVVTFSNGDSYTSEIIGTDAYSDLAVLSVNAPINEFKPLEIANSINLEVGDPVIAIGSPMGLEGSMTTGIVSQIGRTIEESLAGSFPIANIIQTSAPINSGNSGGPLLNYQGEVIGITTAIISNSNGLGFAIPSNTILREIGSLIENGTFTQHSWLGISGVDMSYAIAEKMNVNVTYGWLITIVSNGSAAENAGLKGGSKQVIINNDRVIIGGDLIIAIDGNRIIGEDTLMSYLEEHTQPNDTIIVTIIRDNQQINIPIELGVRPIIS
jgi:S1-C subfamily serine protease